MAIVNKLILSAYTGEGIKKLTYSDVDPEAPVADVKVLVQTIEQNGDVFSPAIQSIYAAVLQTTTTADYDLND